MTYFLSIQNTYDAVEIALFQDQKLLATAQEDKIRASKYFARILEFILRDNNIALKDLSFIAVNQGPGPFTTLRVVIASVNGLSFATKIPLIGVDGLDALLAQAPVNNASITIALLNAFNNDAYFGIQEHGVVLEKGCKNIDILLQEIKNKYPNTPLHIIGNGAQIFASNITHHLGSQAHVLDPLILHASVEKIGAMGWDMWQKKENLTVKLMPLYLKQTIAPPQTKAS